MIQKEKTRSSVQSWMSKWYKTAKFEFLDDSGLDLQELLSYARRDNLGYHSYSPVSYADTTKKENRQTEYVYMGDGMMMEVINPPVEVIEPFSTGRNHVGVDGVYIIPEHVSHTSTSSGSHSSCGGSSSHSCSSHSSCSSSSCSSSSCSSSSCSS